MSVIKTNNIQPITSGDKLYICGDMATPIMVVDTTQGRIGVGLNNPRVALEVEGAVRTNGSTAGANFGITNKKYVDSISVPETPNQAEYPRVGTTVAFGLRNLFDYTLGVSGYPCTIGFFRAKEHAGISFPLNPPPEARWSGYAITKGGENSNRLNTITYRDGITNGFKIANFNASGTNNPGNNAECVFTRTQ